MDLIDCYLVPHYDSFLKKIIHAPCNKIQCFQDVDVKSEKIPYIQCGLSDEMVKVYISDIEQYRKYKKTYKQESWDRYFIANPNCPYLKKNQKQIADSQLSLFDMEAA